MPRQWRKNGRAYPDICFGLAVVTYQQPDPLLALTGCLLAQTHTHFRATAYHDGPAALGTAQRWGYGDLRFSWHETPVRENKHGHTNRQRGFDQLLLMPEVTHLGTTNADNLYAPVYFEAMAEAMAAGAEFAYCDMAHSHRQWAHVQSRVERKFIDAGNWMASRRLIQQVRWESQNFAADWEYVSRIASLAKCVKRIPAVLFVHN